MTHSFPTGRSSELPAHAGEGHRSNQPPVGALKFDILVALAKDREPERYPYPQEAKHRKARDDCDNVDGEPPGAALPVKANGFFCQIGKATRLTPGPYSEPRSPSLA